MSNAQSLRETVVERLKSSAGTVTEKVLKVLLEKELDRRSEMLLQALDKRDALIKEGRKFKPDLVSYAADGTTLSEGWSKPKLDEKNRHQDKLSKLERSIEDALSGVDVDFSKLAESIKKCGETKDESSKPSPGD